MDLEKLEKRIAALESAVGIRGTGACICPYSPEVAQRSAERRGLNLRSAMTNMDLDHRCPVHGEKAQPVLWGRHRERRLAVTPHQWESLGVIYTEPTK